MVPYSIDTNERRIVYVVCALVSVCVASGLSYLGRFDTYTPAALSGLVIFCVMVLLYDRFLWKLATRFGLSGIPNLNGTWRGKLERAADEKRDVTAIITQSWKKIDFCLDSDVTAEKPVLAAIVVDNDNLQKLRLVCGDRAKSFEGQADDECGIGVTDFCIRMENGRPTLEGRYHSVLHRGGRVSLEKVT